MRYRRPALVAIAAAWAFAAAAEPSGRILLVPFENVARSAGAQVATAQALEAALRARGWEVVAGKEVEESLRKERVRYVESIATPALARIAERHGANAVIVGSVLAYAERGPEVSLAARMLSPTGELLWTAVETVHGQDVELAFGRRRVRDRAGLLAVTTARLLERLPPPDRIEKVRLPRPRARKLPTTRYRARDFLDAPRRIAVLPLASVSVDPIAARGMDALLRNRLGERDGIEIVEPADVRAALAAEKVQSLAAASPETMERLSRTLGTTLFLGGTVHRGLREDDISAEVYLSIVDVASKRVLWSSMHSRHAGEMESLFGVHPMRSGIQVADRMLLEMVESLYRK